MSKLSDHIADITVSDYNTHTHTAAELASGILATTTGGYGVTVKAKHGAGTLGGTIPITVVNAAVFGRVYLDYANYSNYSNASCQCALGCY